MNYTTNDRATWKPFGRGTPVQVRIVGATLAKPFRYDVELTAGPNAGAVFRNIGPADLAPVARGFGDRSPLRATHPTKGLRALIGLPA